MEGNNMYLRATGEIIIYIATMAILFFCCLHDMQVPAHGTRATDVGTFASLDSVGG